MNNLLLVTFFLPAPDEDRHRTNYRGFDFRTELTPFFRRVENTGMTKKCCKIANTGMTKKCCKIAIPSMFAPF